MESWENLIEAFNKFPFIHSDKQTKALPSLFISNSHQICLARIFPHNIRVRVRVQKIVDPINSTVNRTKTHIEKLWQDSTTAVDKGQIIN